MEQDDCVHERGKGNQHGAVQAKRNPGLPDAEQPHAVLQSIDKFSKGMYRLSGAWVSISLSVDNIKDYRAKISNLQTTWTEFVELRGPRIFGAPA